MEKHPNIRAFTLIELSIVLVVIGLIVGGILVGQDLIRAAGVRAQISQIEKFSTAANTFRTKYGYLPGDIPDPYASQMGLYPRGTGNVDGAAGAGDGNGLIEGVKDANVVNNNCGVCIPSGEPVLFWNDLSQANGKNLGLIEGSFNPCPSYNGSSCNMYAGGGDPAPGTVPMTALGNWIPQAKLGRGNYVYAYSANGSNYFGVSVPTGFFYSIFTSNLGLTVIEAYNLDKKIDDGLPLNGIITATYVNTIGPYVPVYSGASDNSATTGSATTCYDNGGVTGTQKYSVTQNNGAGVNCALSFKMQ